MVNRWKTQSYKPNPELNLSGTFRAGTESTGHNDVSNPNPYYPLCLLNQLRIDRSSIIMQNSVVWYQGMTKSISKNQR